MKHPPASAHAGGLAPRCARVPTLVLSCGLLFACQPTRSAPGVTPEPPAPLPDPVHTPVNREPGELLEATVPLVDGDGLALTSLRGRVVVLELTATWADRWSETYPFYARLLQQHGPERLAVVVVAMDSERATLSPEPGVRGPGFDLGWDPQGALAARLQVAALPTVVVLDREGRIAFVQGASPPGATRSIEDAISQAIGASGPTNTLAGTVANTPVAP
jgi:hypothetical protein